MNGNAHRKQYSVPAAVAIAAALCLALAPVAAAQEIVQVRAGSASLDFQPVVQHGGVVLTVIGPDGFHHRAEFGAGESPTFSMFAEAGGALPDGSYTWELTLAPTDVQRREALEANRLETRAATTGFGPRIQSGHFAIVGGSLVAGGDTEPDAGAPPGDGGPVLSTKDFVINDDLIVTGSACVGFDCVNGEVFGFDTIRLKENNVRIQFSDTSSTTGFPANNWQIRANSSSSGGANFLAFVDQGTTGTSESGTLVFGVNSGARPNALWVSNTSRVGLGTATPILDLHINTSNTPGLRLEQNNSGGFTAQTWDIAGNEANFFVRDVTGGSRLPFRIRPGAPTSSIDIAANGNVGIGTASPATDADMTIESGESVAILMRRADTVRFRLNNTAAGSQWDTNNDGSGNYAISLVGSGQNELVIAQDGNIGNCNNPDHDFVISTGPGCTATPRSWIDAGDSGFSTTSSRTLKENLVRVAPEGIVEKLTTVGVYEYDFIEGPKDRIGLMAEEFHGIFGRGSDEEISSHEMQVAMWLAIQELAAKNKKLERELEALKRQE